MEKSESIKNLAIALCKFQGTVEKIVKTATNPFFKSKYASLADILDVIREPLQVNGLSFVQFPEGESGLTTMLMHESGEHITATYIMKPVKNDPQGQGSAITYQRRYALGAILGLNIDDDDDGTQASKQTAPKSNTQAPAPNKEELTPSHPKWKGAIQALINSTTTISKIRTGFVLSQNNEELLIAEAAK